MNLDELTEMIDKIDQKDMNTLLNQMKRSSCTFILGNGGSSAIASHMAEDYTKSLKLPAMTFSDAARLTCYANDYGYEYAYAKWLTEFVPLTSVPFVILISSSGNSMNMVQCAAYCVEDRIPFAMLTGFEKNNTMRCNFKDDVIVDYHVPSTDYGIVECMHQIFLHGII